MVKFSFLLPAYKGRFLKKMLCSIRNQTYSNFKCIISDDCSPDNIYSICQPFLQDSRFIYRRNDENMGKKDLVSHWNLLVDLCDTEYLILASDDDVYDKYFLEKINELTKKYPEAGLLRARVNHIDEDDNLLTYESIYPERVTQIEFMAQIHNNMFSMCIANAVFKTEALKRIGGFVNYPFAWFSDNATMIIMSKTGCINTSENLFKYRDSALAISSSKSQKQSIKKIEAAISYHKWFVSFIGKYAESKSDYERYLFNYTVKCHYESMRSHIYDLLSTCSLFDMLRMLPKIVSAGLGSKVGLISSFLRR